MIRVYTPDNKNHVLEVDVEVLAVGTLLHFFVLAAQNCALESTC